MTGRKLVIVMLTAALLAAMAMPVLAATPTPTPTMKASPTLAPSPTVKPGTTVTPAPTAGSQNTVMSALQSRSDFSKFNDAVKRAGLQDMLNANGPYTIFAPTDGAFNKLPAAKANIVNMDQSNLAYTVKYHVVSGKYTMEQLKHMTYLMTLNDRAVPVTMPGNDVMVDAARIAGPGIETSNGIIYPVDNVMIPPMLTA